jgi:hypothetical protein
MKLYTETLPTTPSVSPLIVRDNANKRNCVGRIRNAKAILIAKPQRERLCVYFRRSWQRNGSTMNPFNAKPIGQNIPGREGESQLIKRCIYIEHPSHSHHKQDVRSRPESSRMLFSCASYLHRMTVQSVRTVHLPGHSQLYNNRHFTA